VRVPLPVRVFSVLWLGLAALFCLIGFAATVATLVTGHAREVGPPAAVLGAGAGFVVFGGALIGVALAAGRRDGAYLIKWLREQLQVEP